ncbi:decorin-like [Mytilus californianus]|uniref:decorin-like n=1 Tax=Mytilus californianus TaxID=6549 RepID=UPI0022450CC4|nr:decorin-like [Mytilus californianus]
MHRIIVFIICTVLKCTVNGCPLVCSCTATTVDCNNKNLATVPSEIPNSTPVLDLQNNHLTTIQQGAFSNLPAVTDLYLQNNQLTTIQQGAFQDLIALNTLSLNGNNLTFVREDTFENLTN